ncbi:MAG: hypothetical protein J7M40_12720 [Planctomycetes bacterium]|nr:hypothetical protein [Planctomycetota bacterium]MCD6394358.1 hypothetical protein [Planctomycetota bacterium]
MLVVIAVIALLLAVLLPALKEAKKRAMGLYCLVNLRGLSVAWTLYANENNGKLVSGEVWCDYDKVLPFDWVHPVVSAGDSEYTYGMSEKERELAGIRKGALFPYTETEKLYNCPGDRTWTTVTGMLGAGQSPYRSYAVSWPMNAQWGGIDPKYKYTKMDEIISPANRLVFLEEEEAGGANWGSWILSMGFEWWDPIAIWHAKSSTNLGFADGHSEKHHWVDKSTLYMAEHQIQGVEPPFGEGEDLRYMRRIHHHAFNK